MSVRLCCLLLVSAYASAAFAAHPGPVTVEFVDAEKFTDVKERWLASSPEKNGHLAALRRHVETKAARYLAPGQSLRIEFTDIDLAGDLRPQLDPSLTDVRVVSSVYPPRMRLRYTLRDAGGQVLDSGEARLSDIGFDTHSIGQASDPLRYEKRMLNQWLREQFDR
ncbi:MAG: DUF3016 domain-containing protein [Xanthomonadales bacterium]|nr:hypothetical protein [Xanthomonadales bacterium]MCC6591743.1 DUF3016 domain-containing protein [Xanthomonadales bacterium]MCE7929764.1 DUF3016 domain-containing protein [Xanthomonadales bacterium PRO6]